MCTFTKIVEDHYLQHKSYEEIDLTIKKYAQSNDINVIIETVTDCVWNYVVLNYPIKTTQNPFKFKIGNDLVEHYFCLNGEHILGGDVLNLTPLFLAARLLHYAKSDNERVLLWTLRVCFLQQSVISELSPVLKNESLHLIDKILNFDDFSRLFEDEGLSKIDFLIQVGYIYQEYYENDKFKHVCSLIEDLKEITVNTTGVLGRNTKYQTFDVSQLVLEVKSTSARDLEKMTDYSDYILNVTLNDDLLLEYMRPSVKTDVTPSLSISDVGLLLFYCRNEINKKVRDETGDLIILAYAEKMLSLPNLGLFSLISSLFIRSLVEVTVHRKTVRGMAQLDELCNPKKLINEPVPIKNLLAEFFLVRPPSLYTIKCKLARVYVNGGLHNSALPLLETLERWDDLIECYGNLNKRGKAEELIRQRLEVEVTPTLLCYLGSVTKCDEYYHKAWEISNHKSAASQRGLAFIHFYRKQIKESLPYFRKAVEINSLMYNVWFTYGCACMAESLFKEGATCFLSCVRIDNESSKAWSNMSVCVQQYDSDKKRAIRMAMEAARLDYDNIKLWQNVLYITVDTNYITVAVQAYRRLCEIDQRFRDMEILFALASFACNSKKCQHIDELMELCKRHQENGVDMGSQGLLLYSTLSLLQKKIIEVKGESNDSYLALVEYQSNSLIHQLHIPRWVAQSYTVNSVVERVTELLEDCKYFSTTAGDVRTLKGLIMSTNSTVARLCNMIKEGTCEFDVSGVIVVFGRLSEAFTELANSLN